MITGLFTWKVVVPRILVNPKVTRLLGTIEKLENYAEQIAEKQEERWSVREETSYESCE